MLQKLKAKSIKNTIHKPPKRKGNIQKEQSSSFYREIHSKSLRLCIIFLGKTGSLVLSISSLWSLRSLDPLQINSKQTCIVFARHWFHALKMRPPSHTTKIQTFASRLPFDWKSSLLQVTLLDFDWYSFLRLKIITLLICYLLD